jgi:hypothetical protein
MRSEQSKNPALKSVKGGNPPLPLHASARIAARTAIALVLVFLSIWVAFDFLPALGWAVILALALWPLYARFARLLPARWPPVIAPLAFTVLTGLLLFVPIAIAIHEISREPSEIIGWIARLRDTGIAVPGWVAQLPVASEFAVEWWRKNLSDPRAAGAWFPDADSVSGWMTAFGGQLLHRIFMFFIALTALYELLRHGPWIGERALGTADRILGDPGERLASRMVEAVRGTVNGTVVVAVVEGLLIGVGYFAAGIPNPLVHPADDRMRNDPAGRLACVYGSRRLAGCRRRQSVGGRVGHRLGRGRDADRGLCSVAHAGRRSRAPAVPGGGGGNFWRVTGLRAARHISRTGHYGRAPGGLAGMAGFWQEVSSHAPAKDNAWPWCTAISRAIAGHCAAVSDFFRSARRAHAIALDLVTESV